MKQIKYKLLALSLLFTVGGLLITHTSTASAADIPKAEQRACYDKYSGHGTGDGTDGVFTQQLNRQYTRSNCDVSKGGNCAINGSSRGAIVNCQDPDDPDSTLNSPNSTTGIGVSRNANDCEGDFSTLDKGNCGIINMVVLITNILSGLAGVVIVAMIIVGGIQYSIAGADPSKVQAAKQKIFNALIALLLLVFGFSLIQWLVPGGLI